MATAAQVIEMNINVHQDREDDDYNDDYEAGL
jgi:hypothetical protein